MNRSALVFSLMVSTGVACSGAAPDSDDRDERAAQAQAAVARLMRHPARELVPASAAAEIVDVGGRGGFEYATARGRDLTIALPRTAGGHVAFQGGEASLEIQLRGADDRSRGVRRGALLVYANALGRGSHVYHWPAAGAGDEEAVYFESAPSQPSVSYVVRAGGGVVALTARGTTIDALGPHGNSVFHMETPVVIGADARRYGVKVAVNGCDLAHLQASAQHSCELTLSWPSDVAYPAVLDPEWTSTASMSRGRGDHSAVLLANGEVLVSGGDGYDPVSGALIQLSSAEIYNPISRSWRSVGDMNQARSGHASILLPNDQVLVTGGKNGSSVLSSAEVFDPDSETWSTVGSMLNARSGHEMIEGPNYQPMVVGGAAFGALASAEVYDVSSQSWTSIASLNVARQDFRLALLSRQVIAVSGRNSQGWTPTIERYDPSADQWSTIGSLSHARINHTATTLRDGRVLVTGGVASGGQTIEATAELIDSSGVVTTGPAMSVPRYGHTATLLPSGKVLVVGGKCDQLPCTETSEEYDPETNTWDPAISMGENTPRRFHSSSFIAGGRVLTTGGYDFSHLAAGDPTISWASTYDAAKCKPPGIGGVVTGKVERAPASFDLTAEGSEDWVYEIDGNVFRKATGNEITSASLVGTGTKSYYGTGPTAYSWSDGNAGSAGAGGASFSGALGDGFSLTLPAGPMYRIAKVHLGTNSGSALLRARLTDNSCSVFEAVVSDPSREVTISYLGTPGSALSIEFTLLEAGQVTLEGISLKPSAYATLGFETDWDPTKSSYVVTVDNPLTISNATLDFVTPQWSGGIAVPEQVDATEDGFINYNVDLTFNAWGGDGSPNSNYTASVGSVQDELYAWPGVPGYWMAGTSTANFGAQGRGLRVGHTPLTVALKKVHPDYSSNVPGTPVTVQLDSSVILIPVQVAVLFSDHVAPNTTLRTQLAFFDQVESIDTTRFTNGSTGEVEMTQRSFVSSPGTPTWAQAMPWIVAGPNGYHVGSDIMPDSVWGSCGVQFRLVNYFEIYTDDKIALARKCNDPTKCYPFNNIDDATPCKAQIAVAKADPRYEDSIPLVIFSAAPTFFEARERGRAVQSSTAVCVPMRTANASTVNLTVVGHELGHLFSMDDCEGPAHTGDCNAPTCNIMCSGGGGALPPTAHECSRARDFAATHASLP